MPSATVIPMPQNYLLVIGDAAALAWVLSEERMAFSSLRRSQAMSLEIGDELLIYTTRGCFHNPGRDPGRVMGLANVTTQVRDLDEPVIFGERLYTSGCALAILLLPGAGRANPRCRIIELSTIGYSRLRGSQR